MRLLFKVLCSLAFVGCTNSSADSAVEARDACFTVAKAVDDVTLTTSALRVDIGGTLSEKMTFSWPAAQHGEDYVCEVNVTGREITKFTKNGMPMLEKASQDLRTF